jgi:hypothetical protein
MDAERIEEMCACFLNCDKPHLISYLEMMLESLIEDDIYDDNECYDEDVEAEIDEDGFYSLK